MQHLALVEDPSLYNTEEVMRLLQVESVAPDVFRGDGGSARSRLFGGHLLAQALAAAQCTTERLPHSLHALFLAPGTSKSIDYQVTRLTDGGSFSARQVIARQGSRGIFQATLSFQKPASGLEHQAKSTYFDHPYAVFPCSPRWKEAAQRNGSRYSPKPVEFYTSGWDPLEERGPEDQRHIWVRPASILTQQPIAAGVPAAIGDIFFAYVSDYLLLLTALLPHGISRFDPRLQAASLDHAIWFHQPLRIDQPLLLEISSPSASAGRGLSCCAVYDTDGRRVATVAQEGLIRIRA